MIRTPRMAAGAAVALLGPLLAACGGGGTAAAPAPACLVAKAPTALAIGARSNSPAPQLPGGVGQLLTGTADAGQPITVIRLDGDPKQVFSKAFTPTGANDQAKKSDRNVFLNEVNSVLRGTQDPATDIRAQAPEADVLGALTLAARSTPPGGNVVMVDSGLQTTTPLDFRGGLLQAEPGTVVDYLKKNQQLPDLTGRHVLLSGLGSTASPQAKLDNRLYGRVVAIWTKIAEESGAACVVADPSVNTRDALPNRPVVSKVTPPPVPPPIAPCVVHSYGEGDDVGFLQNSAVFRTPDAAKATLKKLADVLKGNDQTVALTGATSSEGTDDINLKLSQDRADAVKQVLVGFGIAPGRITTNGVGAHLPGRLTDMDASGHLLLGPAVQNRKVIAKLSGKACPSS